MNKEDIETMEEWIVTYFDKMVWPKITNLDRMIDQGFIEEALTLSLCYIEAIAIFNPSFKSPKYNRSKETFINTIYAYSDFKASFSKISRIFLYRTGRHLCDKNAKVGKRICRCKEINAALLEEYRRDNDHHKEMDKDGVIQYLKTKLSSCDWGSLETNLDSYSYAAVLYARGRSSAVHEMGFETVLDKGEPVFERNKQGDDIYYSGDILCFSKEIILSTLKNVHRNLRSKCLAEAKWPGELIDGNGSQQITASNRNSDTLHCSR